jgi:hypothetical protein
VRAEVGVQPHPTVGRPVVAAQRVPELGARNSRCTQMPFATERDRRVGAVHSDRGRRRLAGAVPCDRGGGGSHAGRRRERHAEGAGVGLAPVRQRHRLLARQPHRSEQRGDLLPHAIAGRVLRRRSSVMRRARHHRTQHSSDDTADPSWHAASRSTGSRRDYRLRRRGATCPPDAHLKGLTVSGLLVAAQELAVALLFERAGAARRCQGWPRSTAVTEELAMGGRRVQPGRRRPAGIAASAGGPPQLGWGEATLGRQRLSRPRRRGCRGRWGVR